MAKDISNQKDIKHQGLEEEYTFSLDDGGDVLSERDVEEEDEEEEDEEEDAEMMMQMKRKASVMRMRGMRLIPMGRRMVLMCLGR